MWSVHLKVSQNVLLSLGKFKSFFTIFFYIFRWVVFLIGHLKSCFSLAARNTQLQMMSGPWVVYLARCFFTGLYSLVQVMWSCWMRYLRNVHEKLIQQLFVWFISAHNATQLVNWIYFICELACLVPQQKKPGLEWLLYAEPVL